MAGFASKGAIALAAVALWATVGFGTKAARYFPAPTDTKQTRTEAALDTFMAVRGLRPEGRDRITADGMYEVIRYARPGCTAETLKITVIGNNREAWEATKLRLGGEVAYLEAGQVAGEPQFAAYEARAVTAAAVARLGGARDNVLPVLAISPPPAEAGGRCGLPTTDDWGAFDRLP